MILLALILALPAAVAGRWLPEPEVPLQAGVPQVLEQAGGVRQLLQVEPAETPLEAWSGGLQVPLQAGPAGTLLLPAGDWGREVSLVPGGDAVLHRWRESDEGEPAAWDRYERRLARWARRGGPVPEPPEPAPGFVLEWAARQEALAALGQEAPALLLSSVLADVEALRARSGADHGTREHPGVHLAAGEEAAWAVRGPGVVVVRTRALMEASDWRRYALTVSLDGQVQEVRPFFTTASGDDPAWGWPRDVAVPVPAGDHALTVGATLEDGDWTVFQVEVREERRREGLDTAVARLRLPWRQDPTPLGTLLEGLAQGAPDLPERAHPLLGGPADALARAVIVRHADDPALALATGSGSPSTPLLAWSLARRWQVRRDVDPALLLEVAHLLPVEPDLLADLAAALPGGLVRPRGDAIRTLAGIGPDPSGASRWTQLHPEGPAGRVRVHDGGGGTPRVVLEAGFSATVDLPEPDRPGRFPVLRMQAAGTVRYRVDGQPRAGRGVLDEALSPGVHAVSVEEGTLVLMDAALVDGGRPARDRLAARLPGRWLLPDPGAPGAVELLVVAGGGPLVVSTDDGAAWTVDLDQGARLGPDLARVVIPVGPHARTLEVDRVPDASGPSHTLVTAAFRRYREEAAPPLPSVGMDPLETLAEVSRALVGQEDETVRATLRLLRAMAWRELGMVVSAQREARAVAAMPGATPEQRGVALAIYRDTIPPVHTAEVPGPVTVDAALAWALRERAGDADCEALVATAGSLAPPISWPVHEAASACLLARGDVVGAWLQAEAAGPVGRLARARAAGAGDWRLLPRLDDNGGTLPRRVPRSPASEEDGVPAVARELALGAPWPAETWTVVRDDRQDGVTFEGRGTFQLDLLCRDEGFGVAPGPCTFPVRVDGVETRLTVPDSTLASPTWSLGRGVHQVTVGPLDAPDQALVVRASHDSELLVPQVGVAVHRLGAGGLRTTVAGPVLLRVHVHEGGPVEVSAGGRSWRVEDSSVLPVVTAGPITVRVHGPPETTLTLAHLASCAVPEEERRPLPRPLSAEVPDPAVQEATDLWMQWVSGPRPPVPAPMGPGGTLRGGVRLGDDATGIRDQALDYRYLGLVAGWSQRTDPARQWWSLEARGRASPDGAGGAVLEGSWTLDQGPDTVRAGASMGGSGGAGHLAAEAEVRRAFAVAPSWLLAPYAETRLGWWSGPGGTQADPDVWTPWSADHFFGLGLGGRADWRPLRDLRVRTTLRGWSNPNLSPDHVDLELRADALVLPRTLLRVGPELGWRFADRHRAEGYWRPRVDAGLAHSWYQGRDRRHIVEGALSWFPAEGSVEGWLGFTVELSRGRGLRDASPLDEVFAGALDLPVEAP